jgi:hypothetical protein
MARPTAELQDISLEGEIVEILEEGGHRFAKVKLTAPVIVDLPGTESSDTHLGDRVVIRGLIFGLRSPTGIKEDV